MLWQPDVECDLVRPWLASVLDTLEPTIEEKQVEVLVKVPILVGRGLPSGGLFSFY
jgi:hypothetical protein